MLYDPKWEVEVKADPFSLESLIEWLEKQPAKKDYCFFNTGGCLFHRYFTAMGFDVAGVGGYTYRLRSEPGKAIPLGIVFEDIAAEYPHTFGAALARAREALQR